jgi:hypothetical protein
MADLTQTITNTLTPLGIGSPNFWGTMDWGEKWGARDPIQDVNVAPDMADLTLTPTIPVKDIDHLLGGITLGIDGAVSKDMTISIVNAMTFTDDIASIIKQLGDWDYIFTLPTNDGQDKLTDGFAKVAAGSDDFSKVANGSDNWS